MDLNRVAVFVRVAETESFTAAAEALGLPKSSVSRSVARLEEELGVRLLQRTTRKLSLTEAGRLYFDRARAAMTALETATAAVADMSKEPRGTVRVTAPVDLASSLLVDVVARFTREHPLIKIELHLSARVVDLVEEGFDLAVRAGRLNDSSLVARRLGTGVIGLFASPHYVKRRGRPKNVAELAAHDCVLFRTREMSHAWKLNGPQGLETVEVHGSVEADDLSFVQRAVQADMGIGPLPVYMAGPEAARGELVRILPEHAFQGGPLHVVSPSREYEPARVVLFREFLIDALSKVRWEG